MAVLEVEHITKRFGKKPVLLDVSCTFVNGITALLGPNGAGKSTWMNIMCMLLRADQGIIKCDGQDIAKQRTAYLEKISMQFQNQPMYKTYTAEEYLLFCGTLKGIQKTEILDQGQRLLQNFGIASVSKKRISTFSGGMRQRLALCGTFLGNPEIVFLDEPSAGLDVYEREELKNFLFEQKKHSVIILSTHIVPDIENIADQVVLLNKGRICAKGTQSELIKTVEGQIWELSPNALVADGLAIYHSNGKRLCFSKKPPFEGAISKRADLTDAYFSNVAPRHKEATTW